MEILKPESKKDIKRFLEMSDDNLNLLLATLTQSMSADSDLVELLYNHIVNLDNDQEEIMLLYAQVYARHKWIAKFEHHVKALAVWSIKNNAIYHPDLVRHILHANSHIKVGVLLDVINKDENEEVAA